MSIENIVYIFLIPIPIYKLKFSLLPYVGMVGTLCIDKIGFCEMASVKLRLDREGAYMYMHASAFVCRYLLCLLRLASVKILLYVGMVP